MIAVKILIVEDDSILSERLALMLAAQGYTITACVTTGTDAIQAQQQNAADLILMDIHLPGKLNGIQTASQLRLLNMPFRLIYITTDESDQTFAQGKMTHPDAYLDKPFHGLQLVRAMDLALSREPVSIEPPAFVFFPEGSKHVRLETKPILYLKAERSSTSVYSLVNKDIQKVVISLHSSLVHQQLKQPNIIRVHRSYCVNFNYVTAIESKRVYLPNAILPVSDTYRNSLKAAINFIT